MWCRSDSLMKRLVSARSVSVSEWGSPRPRDSDSMGTPIGLQATPEPLSVEDICLTLADSPTGPRQASSSETHFASGSSTWTSSLQSHAAAPRWAEPSPIRWMPLDIVVASKTGAPGNLDGNKIQCRLRILKRESPVRRSERPRSSGADSTSSGGIAKVSGIPSYVL